MLQNVKLAGESDSDASHMPYVPNGTKGYTITTTTTTTITTTAAISISLLYNPHRPYGTTGPVKEFS